MQSQSIVINQQLSGELYSDGNHRRLILLCHGFQSSKDNTTLQAIRQGLNKAGYATFSFTFSENIGSFDVAHQVGDINAIIAHFSNYQSIILLAASFGALTAAIATTENSQVSGLITLNGFFGRHQLGVPYRRNYWKFRLAALVIPTYRRIRRYYKRQLQPTRITVPVLVIHSIVDQSVGYAQSQTFFEQMHTNKEFLPLENANHGVSAIKDQNIVIRAVCQWLKGIGNEQTI